MTVVRIKIRSDDRRLVERWTAPSQGQIQAEFDLEQSAFPTAGYGTSIYNLKEDPTGLLWHAEFTRMKSCD